MTFPLNQSLLYIDAHGARRELAIAAEVRRRIARDKRLYGNNLGLSEGWTDADYERDAVSTVERDVNGELQIWELRQANAQAEAAFAEADALMVRSTELVAHSREVRRAMVRAIYDAAVGVPGAAPVDLRELTTDGKLHRPGPTLPMAAE